MLKSDKAKDLWIEGELKEEEEKTLEIARTRFLLTSFKGTGFIPWPLNSSNVVELPLRLWTLEELPASLFNNKDLFEVLLDQLGMFSKGIGDTVADMAFINRV